VRAALLERWLGVAGVLLIAGGVWLIASFT